MRVNNISRKFAEKMPWHVDRRHWLISISSSDGSPANITAPFGKVVRFVFDDEEDPSQGVLISPEQAKEIAETILLAEREDVSVLWVHCDAGICRSGAVVEAALLRGHKNDMEVSFERIPNSLVFNEIRKALGFKHSWE